MYSNKNKIHYIMLFLFLCASGITATSVQMRIVKELANYGYFGPNVVENLPLSTVSPANFSGPPLLRRLIGKCYNFTEEPYRYTFCPFQNFTQFELSSRFNAYHGILGVWSHWNITNNTFSSMVYSHGDQCGDIERKVQVYLECGVTEALTGVNEPSRCHYTATFLTKYVCHIDSMLVYPRLPAKLQEKWDQLLTELHNGDITEKGYKHGLEKLFQSASLSENTNSVSSEKKITTESSIQLKQGSVFTDLQTCNKEYTHITKEIARLNQEMEALRLLLDLSKVETRTPKPR